MKFSRKSRIAISSVSLAVIVIITLILITGIIISFYIAGNYKKNIDISLFDASARAGATKIYYYDMRDRLNHFGEPIEFKKEKIEGSSCIYVEYDAVPENLINAFIAIEDKRFWDHSGVDWLRTVKASVNYLKNEGKSFGGSTITQQLIKNITGENQYSKERKIQEIIWALKLETCLSKKEIMELYMNIVNLSHGCTGVQAAANAYFSKDVSQLNLTECTALAAITNNPTYYDPIRHPENNAVRRNLILDQMFEQGLISAEEYNEAYGKALVTDTSWNDDIKKVNSWYTDMVIEDVVCDLCEKYGYTREAASLAVYSGGLKIYTAMDAEVQQILEEYYADATNFPEGNGNNAKFQSSMIVIDPFTGDILGVAGAIGEKSANRVQNYATMTRRPSGSVIKPVSVYAPALDKGIITSASVYDDVPVMFGKKDGKYVGWPQNYPARYRGLTNVMSALRDSVNTVTVRVLEDLGIDDSFDFLYDKLEMKSLISELEIPGTGIVTDRGLASLALGQQNYGVTVREMTGSYSMLANKGFFSKPRSYYKVCDAMGNVILSNPDKSDRVISEETADIMTLMLENVVASGTGKAVSLDKYVQVAGKTGTTQDYCDKWFIGYTPYFIGGVWCGYEYPQSLEDIPGNPCIAVWDEIMTILHKKYIAEGAKKFNISDNIVKVRCCADSGKLLTAACRTDARGNRGVWRYFVSGKEPREYCDCHIPVDYDIIGCGVADESCPVDYIKKVGMIRAERNFPVQVYVSDAQYVWKKIKSGHAMTHEDDLPFFSEMIPDGRYCGMTRTSRQFNRGGPVHDLTE